MGRAVGEVRKQVGHGGSRHRLAVAKGAEWACGGVGVCPGLPGTVLTWARRIRTPFSKGLCLLWAQNSVRSQLKCSIVPEPWNTQPASLNGRGFVTGDSGVT